MPSLQRCRAEGQYRFSALGPRGRPLGCLTRKEGDSSECDRQDAAGEVDARVPLRHHAQPHLETPPRRFDDLIPDQGHARRAAKLAIAAGGDLLAAAGERVGVVAAAWLWRLQRTRRCLRCSPSPSAAAMPSANTAAISMKVPTAAPAGMTPSRPTANSARPARIRISPAIAMEASSQIEKVTTVMRPPVDHFQSRAVTFGRRSRTGRRSRPGARLWFPFHACEYEGRRFVLVRLIDSSECGFRRGTQRGGEATPTSRSGSGERKCGYCAPRSGSPPLFCQSR